MAFPAVGEQLDKWTELVGVSRRPGEDDHSLQVRAGAALHAGRAEKKITWPNGVVATLYPTDESKVSKETSEYFREIDRQLEEMSPEQRDDLRARLSGTSEEEDNAPPKDVIRANIQGGTILIEREEMERLQALGVKIHPALGYYSREDIAALQPKPPHVQSLVGVDITWDGQDISDGIASGERITTGPEYRWTTEEVRVAQQAARQRVNDTDFDEVKEYQRGAIDRGTDTDAELRARLARQEIHGEWKPEPCPDCRADPGWYNGIYDRKPCPTCRGGAA